MWRHVRNTATRWQLCLPVPNYITNKFLSSINKVAQCVLFIAYLYYTCKLSKDITNLAILKSAQSLGTVDTLWKITAMMKEMVAQLYNINSLPTKAQRSSLYLK